MALVGDWSCLGKSKSAATYRVTPFTLAGQRQNKQPTGDRLSILSASIDPGDRARPTFVSRRKCSTHSDSQSGIRGHGDCRPPNNFSFSAVGWVVTAGGAGTLEPLPAQGIAPEGTKVAFSAIGSLVQDVGVPLAGNTEYVLSVDIVERIDSSIVNYKVQLLAGATVIAEDDSTLDPGNGNFLVSTISYISAEDDPLIGQSLSISLSSTANQVNYDEVSLTATAVPPVPSLGIVGIGLLLATLSTAVFMRLQRSRFPV
jgi:hypothetical protein